MSEAWDLPPAPSDPAAEMATVGAALMAPDALLTRLVVDEAVRPEHFTVGKCRAAWAAMLALVDSGEPVDRQTLLAQLTRSRAEHGLDVSDEDVSRMVAACPAITNVLGYARRVVEVAELRRKREGALTILSGVAMESRERVSSGEGMLVSERARATTKTADVLAREAVAFLDEDVEAWPLPWHRLTRHLAGGLRRGQLTVFSGHSSHGKSVVADQVAESASRAGASVHLYLTEMTPHERVLRFVSRHSGLNLLRLMQGKVSEEERHRYARGVEHFRSIGLGMTDAAGWTADDVARDMRLRGYDLAVLDIYNELDMGDGQTADFDRAVRVLKAATTQADCHLLLVAHVNEQRVVSAVRPKPTIGDLRSTGMLKNAASNVGFVYREQTEDGTAPEDDGCIYFPKVRNGIPGGVDVRFDGGHMRFLAVDDDARFPAQRKE